MSGYGVAADEAGNLYFVTGNSDPSGSTYNSVTNISESVAKVSADLTQVPELLHAFQRRTTRRRTTPTSDRAACCCCRKSDRSRPSPPRPAKLARLFLMNQKSLGGFSSSSNHVVDTVNIGGCWCGQSYFDAASDSVPRIVASGGNNVTVWRVQSRDG